MGRQGARSAAVPCAKRGNQATGTESVRPGLGDARWSRLLFRPMTVRIVGSAITRADLVSIAQTQFGDMVKGVVDLQRRVMAIGGELHADEEAALLDDGSRQEDLWGINLYPGEGGDEWIEFDSVINLRPSRGNRSRGVDDAGRRQAIREMVAALVEG